MNIKKAVLKFIASPVSLIISILLCVADIYLVHYLRQVALASFKLVNMLSLLLLVFAGINIIMVCQHKDGRTSELFYENLPAILFFISFVICKLMLRG